jgi:hypothetical protein
MIYELKPYLLASYAIVGDLSGLPDWGQAFAALLLILAGLIVAMRAQYRGWLA